VALPLTPGPRAGAGGAARDPARDRAPDVTPGGARDRTSDEAPDGVREVRA
jgi:hypothetical protein